MMKRVLITAVCVLSLSGCGYNTIQALDEELNAARAGISNIYQKRADLLPNLVEVVKASAKSEERIFVQVAEARSKSQQVSVQANEDGQISEAEMRTIDQSQLLVSRSVGRMLGVVEAYPELKSNQNFTLLQKQLEQIETQLSAARGRYIRRVKEYNTYIRKFPTNLTASAFGHKVRPQLEFKDESSIKLVPKISFNKDN